MSFRQFPAVDADGNDYVVIEFKSEQSNAPATAADPHVRYELADGQRLVRDGRVFRLEDGGLTLTI
ncbi:hypothetical protein ACIGHF_07280 [Stenotrophomonas sp. NPDC077464]|uniref:hypothetical protein n=1 Tax=unclassified Stenotrophomonas TaxID=196198 RepID=UPI0037D2BFE7